MRLWTSLRFRLLVRILPLWLRIPVNVTADSGNVTDVPANVTGGWCCAF